MARVVDTGRPASLRPSAHSFAGREASSHPRGEWKPGAVLADSAVETVPWLRAAGLSESFTADQGDISRLSNQLIS